ncbi:hypothetical protein GPOL_c12690 [Gordonia polyisoprenivorans VH2]|uniref:Uncharacterized protein n=1 Tax=Gordonia polyisoprenivorans (strain DSM 44266 / VH2) TaxID=1112204 RepID=H6N3G5_GORPV|nr:hypothetical protein [Gordonia polyisoprenivorans]AFA72324.1 hypothetical protein GPOL_c12690 [Gordonia polyisoprenivorans VH2]
MGYPVRDFTKLDGGGVQAFQHAVLYHKDGSDHGFYVGGQILNSYAQRGYEKSALGYPTSLEYPEDTGRAQDFEHRSLLWDPTGAIQVLDNHNKE